MKKKLILTTLLCIFSIGWALAQSTTITGTVTSGDDGEPLIGATVQVKGTTRITTTNAMGQYQIAADMSEVLLFQFTGATSQEITISRSVIDVTLSFEAAELDEVMVVAYGTAKKGSFTGSASLIKKDAIEKSQVSSVSKALQGTVAGVQSVAASGQPGTDATIQIRGVGSINAASTPLYVLDGVPYSGDVNSINPADIESISVLKDAASSALYGSRGANGVIIITTKQGRKEQSPRIDAKVTYGVSDRAVSDYKQVSTNQYFEMYWELLRNNQMNINGLTPDAAASYATNNLISQLSINPYGPNYAQPVGTDGKLKAGARALWNDDWIDAYSQDASRFEALVSISGGSKTSNYFASVGYLNDKGVVLGSGFKRYTGRLNLNSDIKSWLKFSGNIALTHSLQDEPKGEDTNSANPTSSGRLIPGFYPVYERDWNTGAYKLDDNNNKVYDFGAYRPSAASPKSNLAGSIPHDKNERKRDVATIRTGLEARLLEGLTFKTSFNADYTNQNNHNYTNPTYGSGADYGGSVSKSNSRKTAVTVNNILNYNTRFNDVHGLKLLAGHEYYEYHYAYTYGSRQNFVANDLYEPDAASQLNNFTGFSDVYKLLSFFGNAEYEYNNKYFASASVRTDGSSRFHPDNRWGVFWSVGASWRVINEDFMKPLTWVSNLTLRASYGAQGNDDLRDANNNPIWYAYQALFAISNNLNEPGITTARLDTKDLKWESNMNFNVGLDVGVFNNRLSGTFEFFHRKSKDLLFNIPFAYSLGYASKYANIGGIQNVGIDISLNGTPIKNNDWTWEIFVNATHYKNKITSLPQDAIDSGNKRLVVGGSAYDFFLAEWAGVNPDTGMPMWYKTENGERVITNNYNDAAATDSKIFAGTSLPDLYGGFGSNLSYKNFDFSFLFAYSIGGKIYNGDQLMMMGTSAGRSWTKEMASRWTPENKYTDVPILQNSTNWTSASTRFLVDADYMRLKNVTLGYSLPNKWLSKVGISNCRVFIQGENLWTIFGTDGMDPEQTVGGATYYRYPAMKTFSGGINLTF